MADGINDLGATAANPASPPFADDVANGLRQIVARAHARGVKVIGTTMGPAWGFRGYEAIESKRLAYNAWMRSEGVELVDGLVDFDAVLRDPANPSHMNPLYLTDGIHPNNLGHQAMADAVNLLLLK
jgi:lysophospholipase L1-like esterase